MTDRTSLGDRMKAYEKRDSGVIAMPLLPVIVRLDGKSFHSWTKGLDRPFDADLMEVMQNVTKCLIEESGAIIGYTQSDEITLILYSDSTDKQLFLNGKMQKLTSILASMCTAYFKICLDKRIFGECACYDDDFKKQRLLAGKPFALFDCRVFQVPTLEEAVNCLIWREQDAVRNSIQKAGSAQFSHRKMYKKSCNQIQEMLFQEKGINWNNYSNSEKRGTYFCRKQKMTRFSSDEIARLPKKHEARSNHDLMVLRHVVKKIEMPILTKIKNRVGVIFHGEEPVVENG